MTTKSLSLSKLLLGIYNLQVNEANFFARKISTSYILLNEIKKYPKIKYETDKAGSTKNLDLSEELLKNSSIWKQPIQEKEILTYRDTFNEYVRKLGISSKNNEILSLENPDAIFLENGTKYDKISRYKNQIFDLALLLKVSPHDAYEALLKHHFLLQSKISTLKTKADLITGYGISLSDLRKDLWVLSFTYSKLMFRLDKMKALNLPLKTWMLRYEENKLERLSSRREMNKAAMFPFNSPHEYLCSRLKMDNNQLQSFGRRHPGALKVKTAKLRQILDFLYSEGFTDIQIYSTPRILCHSITTIKKRLNILRTYEYKVHSLSVLCLSTKSFKVFVQKIENAVKADEGSS